MIEDRITKALEERFESEDLRTCFLVDIDSGKNNKITVFVDSDDRLTIDMCRKISRFLEKKIEEGRWLPEKYTLDVSSPGIDNPLKLHRQYVKNIGRKARVTFQDGKKTEGVLKEVSEGSFTLSNDKGQEEIVNFEHIKETKILVSF